MYDRMYILLNYDSHDGVFLLIKLQGPVYCLNYGNTGLLNHRDARHPWVPNSVYLSKKFAIAKGTRRVLGRRRLSVRNMRIRWIEWILQKLNVGIL